MDKSPASSKPSRIYPELRDYETVSILAKVLSDRSRAVPQRREFLVTVTRQGERRGGANYSYMDQNLFPTSVLHGVDWSEVGR